MDVIFNDDLDILEIIEHGFPRRIYHRRNYFDEMDNLSFFRRFRLTKQTVLDILVQIEERIEFPDNRNNSITPMDQLLATLRLYATGGHLQSVADFMGFHVSTMSRIVVRVSEAIAELYPRYIKLPSQQEFLQYQTEFYNIAAFPRVIGALDCTHIRIQSPGGNDGEVFRNRKSYFSINVQATCDANLKILDLVARWPGSAHDSTIFNNSRLRARMENNEFPNCVLLGDSGYPLRNYLLTPVPRPTTREQQLYNEAHIRTRNTIERMFGVWKRRFPILAYGGRLKMETMLTVIVACGVLHNIACQRNEMEPPAPENIGIDDLNLLIQNGQIPNIPLYNQDRQINLVRQHFIEMYFRGLAHN